MARTVWAAISFLNQPLDLGFDDIDSEESFFNLSLRLNDGKQIAVMTNLYGLASALQAKLFANPTNVCKEITISNSSNYEDAVDMVERAGLRLGNPTSQQKWSAVENN